MTRTSTWKQSWTIWLASAYSPDDDFAEYGLGESRIADLRRWVTGWYGDLAGRLAAERIDDELQDDL
jgi:hypothetical protein